ncbi:MAG TPA: clostripain-related cysteine peptidase, partial [Coleofasciculaceae cyanobacterium]
DFGSCLRHFGMNTQRLPNSSYSLTDASKSTLGSRPSSLRSLQPSISRRDSLPLGGWRLRASSSGLSTGLSTKVSTKVSTNASTNAPTVEPTEAKGDRLSNSSTRSGTQRKVNSGKLRSKQIRWRKSRQNSSSPAEWTVMVYMAGNTLESYALQDFLELAAAGSDSKVNIVVQLDRTAGESSAYGNWTDTRRGLVRPGNAPNANWGTSIGEANMGSTLILKNFVNWSTSTYRAKHYALVMWGHGDGFNVSYDDVTNNGISGGELNQVLSGLPTPVDLVGTDACLMGTTEFAYQICDHASVFVGSQELEPGEGWNYTPILKDLKANPQMNAVQLGNSIVGRYAQTYPTGNETLSATNLLALRSSNAGSLTNAISNFATTLMSGVATSQDLNQLDAWRDRYANDFGAEDGVDATNFCDVGKLFTGFASSLGVSTVLRTAAQAVLDAYSSAILQNYSAAPGRSTGLSLYFSDRGMAPDFSYNSSTSSFVSNTQWGQFLNELWW